jgi:ketosteroid isomerase-like protein
MKLLVCFILLLLSTSICVATDTSRIESELKQIEETRRRAIKDGDDKTLDQIYADDFAAIAGNGQIINKSQLMAVFKGNDPSIEFTTDEISIRIFGTTALFVGRLTGRAANGEVVSASRFTHVFVKRSGKWRCVSGQSTPLPRS